VTKGKRVVPLIELDFLAHLRRQLRYRQEHDVVTQNDRIGDVHAGLQSESFGVQRSTSTPRRRTRSRAKRQGSTGRGVDHPLAKAIASPSFPASHNRQLSRPIQLNVRSL